MTPKLNRWKRFADWDERPLRLDKFAAEDPANGFSAFSSPPWMASVRSAYVASNRGTTNLAMMNVNNSANTIAAITSAQFGSSGFSSWSGISSSVVIQTTRLAENEGEGDADNRQRLCHRESDPGRAHHRATRLGLSRSALDDRGEDQTDANTGADSTEAVTDDTEGSG